MTLYADSPSERGRQIIKLLYSSLSQGSFDGDFSLVHLHKLAAASEEKNSYSAFNSAKDEDLSDCFHFIAKQWLRRCIKRFRFDKANFAGKNPLPFAAL